MIKRRSVLPGTVLAAAIAAAAGGSLLPDCTVTFDGACPNATSSCGASFAGGGGCIFAGLPNCYASGLRSYEVSPALPATITLDGGLVRLEVFFAAEGAAAGEMRFFDAVVGGSEVGSPLASNGDCLGPGMPVKQTISFLVPVRRVEVTASGGTAWIDDFRTNPPNPCPSDTNGDLTTNVDDLVNVIVTWGGPGGAADVNGDCVINVDDLVAVITAWGDCV